MTLGNRIKLRLDNLSKDTAGSMAITWALAMTAVIFAVGATYDMSQITKAKQRAQMAADSMALAASIAVDTDNEKRYKANKRYSYKELGSPGLDFTNSMTGFVVYDIVDDQDPNNDDKGGGEKDKKRLLARATIQGKYKPAFMGAFGYNTVPFIAISDVAYADRIVSQASIFFVTDNSLSMENIDVEGTVKLNALKKSLNQFMVDIDTLNPDDKKMFRTALFPYNGKNPKSSDQGYNGLIKSRVVSPAWGTLSTRSVSRMKAKHFTDSSGALEISKNKFKLEAAIHKKDAGESDPLKFLVFMTDGLNNPVWQKKCEIEKKEVDPKKEYWVYKKNCGKGDLKRKDKVYKKPRRDLKDWKYYKGKAGYWNNYESCDDNGCKTKRTWVKPRAEYWRYYPSKTVCGSYTYKRPKNTSGWKHYPGKPGYWEDKKVCRGPKIETFYRDEKSLKHCADMKAAGVKIYAIAYDVEPEDKEKAEKFMRTCSSGAEYFKSARDSSALEEAFKEIGVAIVKDVIRIKR